MFANDSQTTLKYPSHARRKHSKQFYELCLNSLTYVYAGNAVFHIRSSKSFLQEIAIAAEVSVFLIKILPPLVHRYL